MSTACHRTKRGQAGMTLIEVLVALVIGTVVAETLTSVTAIGLKNVRNAHRLERVHSNATFLSDTMAYWVKQGVLLTVPPSADALGIRLPDSTVKTIAKTGSRATLDGNALTSDDVMLTNLHISLLAHSVRVSFTLQATGYPETFSATTTVAQRNNF